MTACHDVTGIDDVSRLGKGKYTAPGKKAVGRTEAAYGSHDEKKGIGIPSQSYGKTARPLAAFEIVDAIISMLLFIGASYYGNEAYKFLRKVRSFLCYSIE